jgi:asparagine synthase (glutamine-hydrolysing)
VDEQLAATVPPGFAGWEGLSRDQYIEAKTLLTGYLLSSQGDRVAMANSIEGRFPYLDHRVIEFANALPGRYKLQGLTEKAVLKAALRDLLPQEIVTRVKQPYRSPDAASFFIDGKPLPYVEELLSQSRIKEVGYFEPAAVSRLVEKCRSGRAIGFGDNMALVGTLSTMLVHELLVKRNSTAVANRPEGV